MDSERQLIYSPSPQHQKITSKPVEEIPAPSKRSSAMLPTIGSWDQSEDPRVKRGGESHGPSIVTGNLENSEENEKSNLQHQKMPVEDFASKVSENEK